VRGAFGGDAAIAQALGEDGELFGGAFGDFGSGLAGFEAGGIGEEGAEDIERRELASCCGLIGE